MCQEEQERQLSTCAIEAEPIGSTSKLSKSSAIACPSSLFIVSWTSSKGVAGALSQRVTNLLTHAAGARSGFPISWAAWHTSQYKKTKTNHYTKEIKNKINEYSRSIFFSQTPSKEDQICRFTIVNMISKNNNMFTHEQEHIFNIRNCTMWESMA